jgi:acyl-homoserine-lactone acylase
MSRIKTPRLLTGYAAGSLLLAATFAACSVFARPGAVAPVTRSPQILAEQVEVRRTAHGVPHIFAENLAALGYAEAYVQSEDYGSRVASSLLRARGEVARWYGHDSIAGDFTAAPGYRRAVETYALLDKDTREVYEGFAAGVNRYVDLHRGEFPVGFAPAFTGYDVLAKDIEKPSLAPANRFLAKPQVAPPNPNDGSNAWAFAPSRTTSGRAILLRNPHLAWNAGYYEAHIVVPGVLDFYGDLRIGGPFGVIGGFNHDLGWATTNNDPLLWQIYALDVDSTAADHYLLDGASHALDRDVITVQYTTPSGLQNESRESWRTSLGPVIGRDAKHVYVFRHAIDGEYHAGQQFLKMMRARSLDEWKAAMRIGARLNSSFTYADRAGNIFYLWNAMLPKLPHPSGGDSLAIPVHRTSEAWASYVPLDSLPQVLNPPGGYVQNSNDAPYYTNMRAPIDWTHAPAYFPPPKLGLRTQLSIDLIDHDNKMSLEDVVRLKHSYRMLLADRVRDDLVRIVRASNPSGEVARAIDVIAAWDKTVAPESRGGVLFETWWRRYNGRGTQPYAEPWTPSRPIETPRGLSDAARAVDAFKWATDETKRRYGALDAAWGDVHRVRRGSVDVPVGGCASDEGCFRVLTYAATSDGKLEATGSDGWILAVEFGDEPRAYSVLAYGESPNPSSPFFADQAAMFARGELKRVAWTRADVEAQTVKQYHPGEMP